MVKFVAKSQTLQANGWLDALQALVGMPTKRSSEGCWEADTFQALVGIVAETSNSADY